MNELFLLTDGSVNTQSNTGFGAALLLTKDEFTRPIDELRARVKVRKFTQTSSTKLELQTLLWGLAQLPTETTAVTVYTDSQNIISLMDRRVRFEENDYHSKKGLPLRNAAIYQEFFRVIDLLDCKLLKVKGHKTAAQKDQIDRLFALVDKASRKAHRKTKEAAS